MVATECIFLTFSGTFGVVDDRAACLNSMRNKTDYSNKITYRVRFLESRAASIVFS